MKSPTNRKRARLQVSVEAAGSTEDGAPPSVRRLSTPDCMSSPVSHLRALTHDLEEGAKRRRAAQYLRESREAHLRQRRLYLVLDLDETLVHSLRASVRQVSAPSESAPASLQAAAQLKAQQMQEEAARSDGGAASSDDRAASKGGGNGAASEPTAEAATSELVGADEEDEEDEVESDSSADDGETAGAADGGNRPHIGQLPTGGALGGSGAAAPQWATAGAEEGRLPEGLVTLRVQNVEFEMMLRPVRAAPGCRRRCRRAGVGRAEGGEVGGAKPLVWGAPQRSRRTPRGAHLTRTARRAHLAAAAGGARVPQGNVAPLRHPPLHDGLPRVRPAGAAPPRSRPHDLQARPGDP